MQSTEDGTPVLPCFAQARFAAKAAKNSAASSLVRLLTIVPNGLHCSTPMESSGWREREVTGGGKASVKLPQFNAVNTVPSNLRITSTVEVVGVENYVHR